MKDFFVKVLLILALIGVITFHIFLFKWIIGFLLDIGG